MLLGELGVIQVTTGSLPEATATLVESVALCWRVRYDDTLTRALRGLAAVAAGTEQPLTAAHLLGAADAIDASTPFAAVAAARDRDIVAWCLARLADALEATALARHGGPAPACRWSKRSRWPARWRHRAGRRPRGRDLAGDRRA